ncbi:MAG: inorganic phosphate transporter [Ignavibacteriales bacterium]|nr:inorganic phosphate transporter [Ignavibacteriales bacterium]
MELYLIILVVLFAAAISDLIVGVGNDAVNFLNSSIGSKVTSRTVILIIAALGVLAGTLFSSGMMEVARQGIFNPDMFLFSEVMVIFLAVMITDVLLLDFFNTFGLPTSTTVSLVFELLGAAVVVALIKVVSAGQDFGQLINYINTSKAFAIIFGILLSIVIAFIVGMIVSYFTRMLFTFDYKKKMKRYGAIWGAIALTGITYFILIKGAKGTAFLTKEDIAWVSNNTQYILLISLVFWAVVMQMLLFFTKINILKPIVLTGTFALALAFAANDLVNFIGVPLAGYSSYQIAESSGNISMTMEALKEPVQTELHFLFIAGAIMVTTLWLSKKARTVTMTEINLSRQFEGNERFSSSPLSRSIVRISLGISAAFKSFIPIKVQNAINKRFEIKEQPTKKSKDAPSFDLVRASVNLTIASILISFATSLKLPLSTTYVTFMVAMGTSLSDRAWGRESAVYRVNGVLTVIGGWFLTALIAFTVSGIIASIIFFGKLFAIFALFGLAAFILIRTNILHKKREKESEDYKDIQFALGESNQNALQQSVNEVKTFLYSTTKNLRENIINLGSADRNKLKQSKKEIKTLSKQANNIIANILNGLRVLPDIEIKYEKRYGKLIASIQSIASNSREISQLCFDHIDNNHSPLSKEQITELQLAIQLIFEQIKESDKVISITGGEEYEKLEKSYIKFKEETTRLDKNQITRIKKSSTSTRNSLLYFEILRHLEYISDRLIELVKTWENLTEGITGIKAKEKLQILDVSTEKE